MDDAARLREELEAALAEIEQLRADHAAELAALREASELANRAKGEFLANVTHEIRTPMNGVIGVVDLLLTTPLLSAQREYVETIRVSANALLGVVNDILDYSRIEAGKLVIDITNVDVVKLVDDVVSSLKSQAAAKRLLLEAHLAPTARDIVRTDPTRIRQVLVNLVGNALKFTEHGSVTVVATRPMHDDGTPWLRIDVMDTGIGIEQEVLDNLFRPFTQGDVSTTRKYGGTGLGLAISRNLIQLLGGNIGASSTPGHGSTFWFEVPFEPASTAPPPVVVPRPLATAAPTGSAAAPASDQPLPFPIGRFRVLLAEDSAVNRLVAVRMLEQLGLTADVAENGLEAIGACRSRHYDLVLMDCMMPELDGYGATTRLRDTPDGATPAEVPIIALTANTTEGERERCLQVGMDDYLPKPLRLEALREMLEHWLLERPGEGDSLAELASPRR